VIFIEIKLRDATIYENLASCQRLVEGGWIIWLNIHFIIVAFIQFGSNFFAVCAKKLKIYFGFDFVASIKVSILFNNLCIFLLFTLKFWVFFGKNIHISLRHLYDIILLSNFSLIRSNEINRVQIFRISTRMESFETRVYQHFNVWVKHCFAFIVLVYTTPYQIGHFTCF
jgi:hypothetical protein